MDSHGMNALPQQVIDQISRDPFAQALGIEIVQVLPGRATVRMTVRENMLNAFGTPHGGAIFTLADTALALASNSHGTLAVALDVNITYCRPANLGSTVEAVATELHLGRNAGLYQIEVYSEHGKRVAVARGTVFRTGRPHS